MAFSANFACKTGGCEPNIAAAGSARERLYGATLLPVRLGDAAEPGSAQAASALRIAH